MQIANQVVALVMFVVGALGCTDEMAVRATYEPAPYADEAGGAGAAPIDVVEVGRPDTDLRDPDAAPSTEPEVESIDAAPAADKPAEQPAKKPADEAERASTVNINEASLTELTALPGIGPALAERIVEYRDKRPFEKIADIKRVRGIGPAKFAKMKDRLAVR